MKILVVNAGSSSLKYQLIDMDGEKELAKGLVERIGIEGSRLKHSAGGESSSRSAVCCRSGRSAVSAPKAR